MSTAATTSRRQLRTAELDVELAALEQRCNAAKSAPKLQARGDAMPEIESLDVGDWTAPSWRNTRTTALEVGITALEQRCGVTSPLQLLTPSRPEAEAVDEGGGVRRRQARGGLDVELAALEQRCNAARTVNSGDTVVERSWIDSTPTGGAGGTSVMADADSASTSPVTRETWDWRRESPERRREGQSIELQARLAALELRVRGTTIPH
eukprot:NODE_2701_length_2163_cov_3.154715.p2 GENE.NODE_2701_length_2163_cov_3.154715~~NODE_2701_length_2163_cov_3.154715.p2  ORF type:complete len:209 (+),score=57.07 NODE_2701_length_2163_cov_3.154715:1292-1918(+)